MPEISDLLIAVSIAKSKTDTSSLLLVAKIMASISSLLTYLDLPLSLANFLYRVYVEEYEWSIHSCRLPELVRSKINSWLTDVSDVLSFNLDSLNLASSLEFKLISNNLLILCRNIF